MSKQARFFSLFLLIQKGFKIPADGNFLKTHVFVHQSAETKKNNFMLLGSINFVQHTKIQKYFYKNL